MQGVAQINQENVKGASSNVGPDPAQEETLEEMQKPPTTFFKKIKRAVKCQVISVMGTYYKFTDGTPVEIIPGLYLGSIGSAYNKQLLIEYGVKDILNCYGGLKEAYPKDFKYKNLALEDAPTENITRFFEETSLYIHNLLSQSQKVLVHCYGGKSRSVSIVISYLLKYQDMTVDQALEYIRGKRSVIEPNPGFVEQLREYERKLKEN